ncbi:hypothetical protein [Nocardia ignorata]|uniref:Uncharacterized protein n=1 Tax=Nocardia ignorata TaxID=145285 RepID=A0A4R6NYQ6_NOCIG|nr:hypothetical protein [Nocardia ignorata]TDP28217.1 hypothetical protein DFR75_1183 [Nocardia ignorata]
MSVTPTSENSYPLPPESPGNHPLLALGLAVALATAGGVLVGWEAAVTVLVAVLGLFVAYRNSSKE